MRAAKGQASLRIRAVSPEPSLLAHTNSVSRGTFRQKARSLAPLNGWACAVKICHDGMLEDTNSLDEAHILVIFNRTNLSCYIQMADMYIKASLPRSNEFEIGITCHRKRIKIQHTFDHLAMKSTLN